VSRRQASALWGFANRVLSILWSPILRDLGEVIEIYEADCGTKVAEAVLRLSKTVLRLSGTVV
jgi:hypothetical protein